MSRHLGPLAIVMATGLIWPCQAWTPDQTRRMEAGEVLVLDQAKPGGGKVEAGTFVKAAPKLVYELVADPKQAVHFSPGLVGADILQDNGATKVVRMHAKQFGIFDDVSELDARYQPYSSVTWRQLKRKAKTMSGQWQVEGHGDGTLLTYRLDVVLAEPVPSFVTRWFLSSSVPNLLKNVRRLLTG